MNRSTGLAALVALLIAGCGDFSVGTAPSELAVSEASTHGASLRPAGAAAIPGQYIVVFRPHVTDPERRAQVLMQNSGGRILFVYRSALKGFAATIPDSALQRILADPDVAYVEPDQVVTLSGTQDKPTWGLDRADQAKLPLDSQYAYAEPSATVHAYVIDTGIRKSHQDFGGRVVAGYTSIDDGRGTDDCNGHGTHVAGTVGGSAYGIAKSTLLVPVRVLNCRGSGTWSGVIAGVDWVTANAKKPAVGNMSLGGGASQAVDDSVTNAIASGVTMVVAAGNDGADACSYSPARTPLAITVGATSSSDVRASWSNYGTCLDLFAPGVSITSAWHSGDTATNTISGTSMASPHVAGTAALLLGANPGASPTAVTGAITEKASQNVVSDPGAGSPNRLVYSQASMSTSTTETLTTQLAVGTLTGSRTLYKNRWTATATVTVVDAATGSAVGGATVSGAFSLGGSGSCTTSATGVCSTTSGGIKNSDASTTYSISSITGTNMSDTGTGPRQVQITKDGF